MSIAAGHALLTCALGCRKTRCIMFYTRNRPSLRISYGDGELRGENDWQRRDAWASPPHATRRCTLSAVAHQRYPKRVIIASNIYTITTCQSMQVDGIRRASFYRQGDSWVSGLGCRSYDAPSLQRGLSGNTSGYLHSLDT